MPIKLHHTKEGSYYQWGHHGAKYPPTAAGRMMAARQAGAAHAHGYVGKGPSFTGTTLKPMGGMGRRKRHRGGNFLTDALAAWKEASDYHKAHPGKGRKGHPRKKSAEARHAAMVVQHPELAGTTGHGKRGTGVGLGGCRM